MTDTFVLTAADVHELGERGWFLRDGHLGAPAALAVANAIDALAAAGRLHPAGVSRGALHRAGDGTRTDAIGWLTPEDLPPAIAPLWGSFLALRDALNREAYLGLDRMEVQAARYPPEAAGYRRHRDAFPIRPGERPNRRVTATYYANPGWQPEDGGSLRLHVDGRAVDVAPRLDRLLVFLSERVEHEVLPTRAARRAVTAWFRARDPLVH